MKLDINSRDLEEKEIGDLVELAEVPFIVYFLTYPDKKLIITPEKELVPQLLEFRELIEKPAVLIKKNLNIEFLCGACDNIHDHNCVVYYPHNKKKYYTSMDNLSLVK